MPPREPLIAALPLALIVLGLGWRLWRRNYVGASGWLASAIAIAGGWLISVGAASGLPEWPPRAASQRLWFALAAALLLSPLEIGRWKRWAGLVWSALVLYFLARTLPAFARSFQWTGSQPTYVLALAWLYLLLLRVLTQFALRRASGGPRLSAAFGLSFLALGIAQALAGSIGLATGFAGAAVGASTLAGAVWLRLEDSGLRAAVGVLALVLGGGIVVALASVPAFDWPAAIFFSAAPFLVLWRRTAPPKLGGLLLNLCPTALAAGAGLAWVYWHRTPSPY